MPGVEEHIYIMIHPLFLHLNVTVVESAKWLEIEFPERFFFSYGIASSKLILLRNTIKQHKSLPLNPINAHFNLLLVISHKISTATSILPIIRENVIAGKAQWKE